MGKQKIVDQIAKTNEMIPCSQEGRISHIETLVEVKLQSIDDRLDRIEMKLNNGLSEAVRKNTEFREILEEERQQEKEDENKDRRKSKWKQLPLWKKFGIISGIALFMFRPEVKELLTLILKHYFKM